MSKPFIHALSSSKKFGGKPDDYLVIHNWFDQTKAHIADNRHRVILHSSFGIFLAEQVFGVTFVNSNGKTVSVRDVGEQHILEDLGRIPSIQDYLENLPMLDWFGGKPKEKYAGKEKLDMLEKQRAKIPEEKFYDGSIGLHGGGSIGEGAMRGVLKAYNIVKEELENE